MSGGPGRIMIRYALYRILQYLVHVLPLRLSLALACIFSDIKYFFSRVDRASVRKNLITLLPQARDVGPQVREVFRNFAKYLVEFCWMKNYVNETFIRTQCVFHGLEHLDQSLALQRGVLMVTAHLGNWEMGGTVLSRLGYRITAVAMVHPHPAVNAFFDEQRQSQGIDVVPMKQAARSCLKALAANRIVAMIVDRDFSGHGMVMPFLGRQVSIPRGTAILALKTGAPIVPAFFLRRDHGCFEILIHPPILVGAVASGQEIDQAQVRVVMEKYVQAMEQVIRDNPAQWLMMREY